MSDPAPIATRPSPAADSAATDPDDPNTAAIEVRNLSRSFPDVHAVRNVSFTVARGQVIGFVGANGAGKTTTMRILATLDHPDSGGAKVCGFDVVRYPAEVRRRIGWMPDHYGTYSNMTVLEYLDFFARALGFRGEALASAGLERADWIKLDTQGTDLRLLEGLDEPLLAGLMAVDAEPGFDQHYETAREIEYWEAFLDMMAENRFNVLSLWNLHPFTYMIRPANFPEASPWTEAEQEEWRELYTGIFRMARERGIDTYIVPWSIFVSEEFAQAHNVGLDNFYPHYYVEGDTSEVIKRYTRESVTQVLNEYPDLTGFAISHGEGMAGMTPRQRQNWMDETIIEGMRLADRPVKFIHRVPFSAGLGSEGSTSEHTEQITREAMEKLDFFEGPIWVEMKFNWSHALSTPHLIKVHGGELGPTYFDPEPENYKVTWMARNEDIFALRWGVPNFIRSHIAINDASYVGGYFVGSDTYIPAKDYFTAIDDPVDWDYAFQRQWLFYQLWGRLLYDPETPDDVFREAFTRRYGPQSADLLEAYSLASATALRLASAWDFRWDFTLYSEGFMSLNEIEDDYERSQMEYISVDRLIARATTDPNYVSVEDYVAGRAAGVSFREDQVTPPVLIRMLEEDNRRALALVENIETRGNASLLYEVSDVKTWANIGLHYAEKLRGAVALQEYRTGGGEDRKADAVRHLENALGYWDEVIAITRPLYRDMHLTHYMGGSFTRDDERLFHWEHLRPEVAMDVEIARSATRGRGN